MTERPVSHDFGSLTFGLAEMRQNLPRAIFDDLQRSLDLGRKLGDTTADAIADAVKHWSVKLGATHYCHWFQPMTGLTAEKHDAFISVEHANHSETIVLERLSGQQLSQGEPDASSFPSGGMRTTFEARGYTAWDPGAPMFIVDQDGIRTLCIPSVFIGYHGEALDHKTPLLRSEQALSKAACKFLKLVGDVDVKRVIATLGVEQEYFLVDRQVAGQRPDLALAGRALVGSPTTRGQKLNDHYFGAIPRRALQFMADVERELFNLGVPVKTRHNEVAPSQYEMAPIYERASLAADHNALAMETMKRVAAKHDLLCLFHEKPFPGVNGSGKHCNWSLQNDKGENLLDPGRTPHQNLRFLAMTAVVIEAIYRHGDVLAASVMTHGNELRLGGHEAPPPIMSVFLGEHLESVFRNLDQDSTSQEEPAAGRIDLGIGALPDVTKDYADRNRTSPFAFTGNKFEFRAVGSSQNVAVPMAVLNGAVTQVLSKATAQLKAKLDSGLARDQAVMALIRDMMAEVQPVLFSGDNYDESWLREAATRGLGQVENCARAFGILANTDSTAFLADAGVLTEPEIKSRHEVACQRYVSTRLVEWATAIELVGSYVVPALEQQCQLTGDVYAKMIAANASRKDHDIYDQRWQQLQTVLTGVLRAQDQLQTLLRDVEGEQGIAEKVELLAGAGQKAETGLVAMVSQAEQLVGEDYWRLPKSRSLLFHPSLRG